MDRRSIKDMYEDKKNPMSANAIALATGLSVGLVCGVLRDSGCIVNRSERWKRDRYRRVFNWRRARRLAAECGLNNREIAELLRKHQGSYVSIPAVWRVVRGEAKDRE